MISVIPTIYGHIFTNLYRRQRMTATLPKVLICTSGLVWTKEDAAEKFSGLAELVELTAKTRDEFFADCKAKYDGVTAIYRHNDSVGPIGFFDKELIDHLPESVKLIAHNGAGYDQIDVAAASARGIKVTNTPKAVDSATATVGVYLVLSALRQFHRAEVNVRSGRWKSGLAPAFDPDGKTVGIIGMGGIGATMARRLLAFDMKIVYHNRRELSPPPDFSCTYCASIDELLAQSDVVSLNLPLNDQTRGSFGREQFRKMKKGATLVNTARGGVVDEDALIEALQSGHLFSAGLDVFPDEPNVNPRLLAMDNITLLPHMCTETQDTQRKMELLALDNIAGFIAGKGLLTQVAEQKR